MKLTKEGTLLLEFMAPANQCEAGIYVFMLGFKDMNGTPHVAFVGCKPNHAETVEKSFRRLSAIKPPKLEEEKEDEGKEQPDTDSSPELRPGDNGEGIQE